MIAGNDADVEMGGAEPVAEAFVACSQFFAGGSTNLFEEPQPAQFVHQFAAVIWRREHHDAAEVGDGMLREITSHEDSAERMSDEMNLRGAIALAIFHRLRDHRLAQLLNRRVARG